MHYEIWFKCSGKLESKTYFGANAEEARAQFYNEHSGCRIISVLLAL